MRPNPLRWLLLSYGMSFPVQAQDILADVRELEGILQAEIRTEADLAERRASVATWWDGLGERPRGDFTFLDPLVRYYSRTGIERDRAAEELYEYLQRFPRLPPQGLHDAIGDTLLHHGLQAAERGDWPTCSISLPLVLRYHEDHRSVFWLYGRRARDHGAGKPFLQSIVIPALLVDPEVSDPDRVHILRKLYEVEYSGPRPLTDLAGVDLDGEPVSRRDFEGKVLLVDFWATWCVPCLMEMPNVVAAERRYRDEGFAILGVSLDRENAEQRIRTVMADQGMTWPQLYDGGFWETKWAVDNDILAIPAAFLIDRSGKVRYTNLTGEELHRRIEELLDEG